MKESGQVQIPPREGRWRRSLAAAALLLTLSLSALALAAACGDQSTPNGATPSPEATVPTVPPTARPGPTDAAPPAGTPPVTPGPFTTYEVQPGDTLYAISLRFGTTVEAIVAANHLAEPSLIYVGQVLLIPAGDAPIPSPPPAGSAQVIRRGDPGRNVVALTFDAGSDTGFTAQILDTLEANDIVASFGITGRWAEDNPELLRRIVGEGHVVMNHTYSHRSFTGGSTGEPALGQAQRWEQLDRTEEIIGDLAGVSTKPYFRPPYGDYDDSVNADVFARGYRYNVLWTVDSLGWNGLSAAAIVERCLSGAEPGAIYLLHVGSESEDAAALQQIIDGLRAMGYGFASMRELAPP